MALDDATAGFLAQPAESGAKPLHEMTPEEARSLGGMLRELYGPGPELPRVSDEQVSTSGGSSFGVRVLVPNDSPRAVIVYYHGGGWVIGAIDEFDTLGRRLAERTGAAAARRGGQRRRQPLGDHGAAGGRHLSTQASPA
ncbi:alpha/beta hydrolase fold domain-containing protein [Pseudonocardia acidicola]|uniref:alpha/beta hydrolase fold domain-containing protein n=1 Tax=Pseudonocardia acidicola TaxID=2724939 RepID=UPI001B7D0268|nr:alpha/beta hydrolase fold domain-containing protein [Pseudonocardia acidicola]